MKNSQDHQEWEGSCAIANKLGRAQGPVSVLWPGGLSTIDSPGKPFWDPKADRALLTSLKKYLDVNVVVIEIDRYMNEPEFDGAVFEEFMTISTG